MDRTASALGRRELVLRETSTPKAGRPPPWLRRQVGQPVSARHGGGGQPPESCRPPRPRQRANGQKWSVPRRSPEAEAGRPDVCMSALGPSLPQAARPSPRPRRASLPSLSGASPDPTPAVVRSAGLAAAATNSSAAKLQLQDAAGRTWPPQGDPHCRSHDLIRRGRPSRPPDHPTVSSSFADTVSATTYPRPPRRKQAGCHRARVHQSQTDHAQ